jgi:mono/diheme cytochrome c family protein
VPDRAGPARAPRHRARLAVAAVVALGGALVGGCDVPTPLAPAPPIGEFPQWGADFATPRQQPQSALGGAMAGGPMAGDADASGDAGGATSSTGQAMPGAIKSFSGGDATLGKGVYLALCARCHGSAGEGGALPGNIAVPAFSDAAWQDKTTDAQMARSIALGKGAMPSFRAELGHEQLSGVIAFIRTLKK